MPALVPDRSGSSKDATEPFKAADPDHDGTLDAKELESPEGKQLLKLLQ